MKKIILLALAALISAGAYAATITPQRGGGIGQFDGGVSSTGTVSTAAGCSGTSLVFTTPCNSMYVAVIK